MVQTAESGKVAKQQKLCKSNVYLRIVSAKHILSLPRPIERRGLYGQCDQHKSPLNQLGELMLWWIPIIFLRSTSPPCKDDNIWKTPRKATPEAIIKYLDHH